MSFLQKEEDECGYNSCILMIFSQFDMGTEGKALRKIFEICKFVCKKRRKIKRRIAESILHKRSVIFVYNNKGNVMH